MENVSSKYLEAVKYYDEKLFDFAMTLFLEVVKEETDPYILQRAYGRLAKIYMSKKDNMKAIECLNICLEFDNNNSYALCDLARVYSDLRDYKKAYEYAFKALSFDAANIHALKVLVRVSSFYDCFNVIDSHFSKLLKEIDDVDNVYRSLYIRFLLDHRYLSSAEHEYRILIDKCKDNKTAIYELCDLYVLQGKIPEAIEQLKILIKDEPTNIFYKSKLAKLYRKVKNLKGAVEEYEGIIELKRDDVVSYSGLGRVYSMMGEFKKAEYYLLKGLSFKEYDLHLLLELGRLYSKCGFKEKSEHYLLKANKFNPNDYYVLTELGKLYLETARYEKAIEVLEKVIKLMPNDICSRNELGKALIKMHLNEEALEQFSFILKNKPDDFWATYYTGECYYYLKDYEKADYYVRQAISINDNFVRPYVTMISILTSKEQIAEVDIYKQKIIELQKKKDEQHSFA